MAAPARAVCIGEGLVVLQGADRQDLDGAEILRRSVGGAECNVAGGLSALGVPTAWVSRLGEDPFGRYVVADLASRGVDVGAVHLDPERPTGLYLKDRGEAGSRMHYYRTGSAATAIDAGFLSRADVALVLASAEVVHVTGITLGVVADPQSLVSHLVAQRDRDATRLSVDLNWRPVLWKDRDPAPLLRLMQEADVVFAGADEAEASLGAPDLHTLRARLGPRPTLVLKTDEHVATASPPQGPAVSVPALQVEVREPIGAGDGFAAGFLAADLEGRQLHQCLRLGHLNAAGVLAVEGDHATPPEAAVREALLSCPEDEWARTRVTSRGISSSALPAPGWSR